jgi:hypothetical protein
MSTRHPPRKSIQARATIASFIALFYGRLVGSLSRNSCVRWPKASVAIGGASEPERQRVVTTPFRFGFVAATAVLGLGALTGCADNGGSSTRSASQPSSSREVTRPAGNHAISAWRAAGASYDQKIQYCESDIANVINYWAHCTSQARRQYVRSAQTLTEMLRKHSRPGPCRSVDLDALRDVQSVTQSYMRVAVVTNRFLNLATRREFKRASQLPHFGRLVAHAHITRLRATAAVAALAANNKNRCLA